MQPNPGNEDEQRMARRMGEAQRTGCCDKLTCIPETDGRGKKKALKRNIEEKQKQPNDDRDSQVQRHVQPLPRQQPLRVCAGVGRKSKEAAW